MKPTLIIIIERARAMLKNALHRAIIETQLPAYLIEGILLDLLADVRAQKEAELAAAYEEAVTPSTDEPDHGTDDKANESEE